MKHLLLSVLISVAILSGCETPQEANQPAKPTAYDSTASIDFTKLSETTYTFATHKADARLHTEWRIEGAMHAGDTYTHTFLARGQQIVQARLLDSTNAVIRTLDTLLFVDTIAIDPRGVVDPSLFLDCNVEFVFNGRLTEAHEEGPIPNRWNAELTQQRVSLELPLVSNRTQTETSFTADTLADHLDDIPSSFYEHRVNWSMNTAHDTLLSFLFKYEARTDVMRDQQFDYHESTLTDINLSKARLESATANQVVYVIDGPEISSLLDFDYSRSTKRVVYGLTSIDWSVPSSARIIFTRK